MCLAQSTPQGKLSVPNFMRIGHQFSRNSWRRKMFAPIFASVDVHDTFFDSDRKSVAMVTAYYGKNGGKILRRELLPQFFTNSHEIWHRCLPWGVDVQDTFFDSGRKCVAMVTAYYGKNGGKILRRELLPQFFTNSHEIWHRCLPWGVDVQDTLSTTVKKCVLHIYTPRQTSVPNFMRIGEKLRK